MGGCSLFDPYVKVDNVHIAEVQPSAPPTRLKAGNAPPPAVPQAAAPPTDPIARSWHMSQQLLQKEHISAQRQADSYRWAVKTPARFKNGLALGLPLLGGAVAIAGATHDRSDFPLIAGVAGATTLGVAGLLISPARSAIYLQAQTATLCAMAAYDVYFVRPADYTTYLADNSPLASDIVAVTKARADVKTALDLYMNDTPAAMGAANLAVQPKPAKPKSARKKAVKKKALVAPAAAPAGAGGKPAPAARSAAGHAAPTAATVPDAPPLAPPAAAPPAAAPPAAAPAAAALKPKTPGDKVQEAANGVQIVANDLLSRADSDQTGASATQTSLAGVRERVDEAGRSLGDRRMAIKTQVDQSLQTTELTLDQIKAAISTAALASNQPASAAPAASNAKATGAPAAQAATEPTVQGDFAPKGRAHTLWLKMQILETALTQEQIDKIVPDAWLSRELQKEHLATQVASCAASAQAVLTATPPNPAQVANGKSLNIPIHAPTVGGAPTASKLADGLTAVMTATGAYDYTLVISESGTPKPATKAQTVVITSGAQSVNVPFSVTDATDSTGSGGGNAGNGDGGASSGAGGAGPLDASKKTP